MFLAACSESPVAAPLADPAEALFATSKVDVCHIDGQGRVNRITIADAAYQSHLDHGDLAPESALAIPEGATFSASGEWLDGSTLWSADKAFDGDPVSRWNSGGLPGGFPGQWIEIDFGSPQTLSAIDLLVHQVPDGFTTHYITIDGYPGGSFAGYTVDGQVLTQTYPIPVTGQVVRVTTTTGPSWVAWYEIGFTTINC